MQTVCQNETALKLPCGNPAMQKFARLFGLLRTADHKLIAFDRHLQLVLREASHSQHDADAFALSFCGWYAFDVIRRIPVAGTLCDTIEHSLDILKAQE